jgi:hypothetical protein
MKAKNDGQHSLNYTWMTQKPTDMEFTSISSGLLDEEHEWGNGAMTQIT